MHRSFPFRLFFSYTLRAHYLTIWNIRIYVKRPTVRDYRMRILYARRDNRQRSATSCTCAQRAEKKRPLKKVARPIYPPVINVCIRQWRTPYHGCRYIIWTFQFDICSLVCALEYRLATNLRWTCRQLVIVVYFARTLCVFGFFNELYMLKNAHTYIIAIVVTIIVVHLVIKSLRCLCGISN